MGYCYLLTKLAHTCYTSRKYSESEKYFKVCAELLPLSTKNPVNIFASKMNLLLLFTHTDIQKAVNYAERLLMDVDDFLPVHKRQLFFQLANIYCLSKQYDKSKAYYR